MKPTTLTRHIRPERDNQEVVRDHRTSELRNKLAEALAETSHLQIQNPVGGEFKRNG